MRTRSVIPAVAWLLAATAAQAQQPTLFPLPAAPNVCVDVPLRITFDTPPKLGTGHIEVHDAADGALVESIDVTQTKSKTIGGLQNFTYRPVIISGNSAIIALQQPLQYHKHYYVTIDAGAIGDIPAITGQTAWTFSTKDAPPVVHDLIHVQADGTGDFASVQGAIDAVPQGNNTPITIQIGKGTYEEIVCILNRNHLTFLGDDRQKTIIEYPNNDKFNNNSNGNPFAPGANPATAPARTGSVYRRGMFLAHRVTDLTIANLTLHNTTPKGGSQAEALILNGTAAAHAILTNCDLYSFQDTLQINGQAYISDCFIEGDVDFMWGTGPCFFENVHARSLRSGAYYTQIRNPATHHGYVYKDCLFDGAEGVVNNMLSRIEPLRFPGSEVVLLKCVLTPAVSTVAWRIASAHEAPDINFWEYNRRDPSGKPVDVSKRLAVSKQLQQPGDAETIAHYSDPAWVLGGDWKPQLGPLAMPETSIHAAAGSDTLLRAPVLCVPPPTVQWQRAGQDLPGKTGLTLTLPGIKAADAGEYAAVIQGNGQTVTVKTRLVVD